MAFEIQHVERHVRRYLEEVETLHVFVDSYMAGSYGDPNYLTITALREAQEKLGLQVTTPTVDPKHDTRCGQIIEFNTAQSREGYPYLTGVLTLRVWTAFEATLDDILLEWLAGTTIWQESAAVRELKGPLIEFASSPRDMQAEFIAEQLRATTRATLKLGVGRFEELFMAVGLGGPIDDDVRRTVYEFSQVRNALAHRAGVADRRFVERCSWFNISPGNIIPLRYVHLRSYIFASFWYVVEVLRRVENAQGWDSAGSARIQQTYLKALNATLKDVGKLKEMRAANPESSGGSPQP
jgi:hypothetical protein